MIAYRDTIKNSRAMSSFLKDVANDRNAHAYLVVSPDALTLSDGITLMAQGLLCENKNACGKCLGCVRVEHGSHTNVKTVANESNSLKVADIGELVERSVLSGLESGNNVFVIPNGEKMNEQAQNKLLKTLEEPSEGVVIIIGVPSEGAVLQTIRSRCKIIHLPAWDYESLTEILSNVCDDKEMVKLAADFSGGSLESAMKIISDQSFKEKFVQVSEVMTKLNKSAEIPAYLGKLGKDKDSFLQSLSIMENIIGKLEKEHIRGEKNALTQKYSLNTLANMYGLITDSYRKLNSNCNITSVETALLLGILELRYRLS